MKTFRALLATTHVVLAATLTGCGQAPVAAPVVAERPAGPTVTFGAFNLEADRPVTPAEAVQLDAFAHSYGFGTSEEPTYALQAASGSPALEAQIRKQMNRIGALVFSGSDKNRDGKLVRSEVPNVKSDDFKRLDKNRNGAISQAEMARYDELTPASEIARQVKQDLAMADEVLRAVDKNRDNRVSNAEYRAGWASGFMTVLGTVSFDAPTVAKFFQTYAGKNGQLSREGVAQVIAEARFTIGFAFLALVLGSAK